MTTIAKKWFLLLAITAGLVTSCKDYDDDIDGLNEDIAAIESTLTSQQSAITAVQSSITTQIAALKTQLEAAIATGDNAAKADAAAAMAKAVAVETAVANLTATVTTLQTQLAAKASQADLDAVTAQVAALSAQIGVINTTLTTISAELVTIDNRLTEFEADEAEQALKLAALEAQIGIQEDALEAFKALVNGDLDEIRGFIDALNASQATMQENIAGLTSGVAVINTNIEGINASIEELQGLIAGLTENQAILEGNIEAINTTIDGILDDIADIQASIDEKANSAEVQAAIDALQVQINSVNASLNVLTNAVNAMITNITFLNSLHTIVSDLPDMAPLIGFTTTVAKQTLTFAPGVTGAVSFVKDESVIEDEASVVIQVSPANADLSKMLNSIYLVDSEGNTDINDFIEPVKAERYTKLFALRGGPIATGLWQITFRLPAESNFEDLEAVVMDDGDPIIYAIAIENKVAENEADRHVVSEFACFVGASDMDGIGELGFEVKGSNDTGFAAHTTLRNRYEITESGIAAPLDSAWADPTVRLKGSATVEDDPDDVRSTIAHKFVGVEVGKPFWVRLDDDGQEEAYAYYVTLDKKWAVESSPSEINAWNSYDYGENLDKIYMADETAELTINSQDADGDIIGFRVFAVNADGTLVDPDGKSFYVFVGDISVDRMAFVQDVAAYVDDIAPALVAPGTAIDTDVKSFAPVGINLGAIDDATFSMTIGNSVTLNIANLKMLATDGVTTVTTWGATKNLQVVGVKPTDLQEGVTYNGTLTLLNVMDVVIGTVEISLTKAMPTFDTAITYKTNIHHEVNGQQVVYAYPMPGTAAYNLGNALNGLPTAPTLGAGFVVTNKSTYPGLLPTWNTTDTEGTVVQSEIGRPYLPTAAPGHGKIYDLELSKDLGAIYYSASSPRVAWAPEIPIRVEFRSFIQDLADWKFTGTNEADYPALVYGDDLTGYDLAKITALPPAGARVDMTQEVGALQDGRTFDVVGVKLLTGAGDTPFTVENEYYTPVINGTAIDFTAIITSTPVGPVPTKIVLTLQDDFGHQYSFTVPKVFNMVLN